MASYKVAQDVEADDKLLGPFTFRQMIYLAIVAMCGGIAYGLWQLLPPLAMIPLPIMIFFGALALPLRKDQPMETYLAALISYYLKPRKRMWVPDGIESLVTITAPRVEEASRVKSLSETEAEKRLAYLATIVDTGGWAVRNVMQPESTSMVADAYNAAQQIEDPLDNASSVGQSFERMIDQADISRRQQAIAMMHQQQQQPTYQQPDPQQPLVPQPVVYQQPVAVPAAPAPQPTPVIQQNEPPMAATPVITPQPVPVVPDTAQPLAPLHAYQAPPVAQTITPDPGSTTSDDLPSPDIMELANNKDLSIQTIAHEANRRHKKHQDDEVVISLR